MSIITRLLGDPNAKVVKKLRQNVEVINALEAQMVALSNEELRAKTAEFKERLAAGATLDAISAEAFAVVREAAKRALGQRHYDVQLMGAYVLHTGGIAEMRTGEGKTLTATPAIYLNALTGKGVHVVTVNDYLAKRDAVWMGRVLHFLGLTLGVIQHESGYAYDDTFVAEKPPEAEENSTVSFRVQMDSLRPVSRKEAYAADVTYGTNNEFGFDYLRDNMAQSMEETAQRGLNFAIVDEVDSILIDEARTPLIISAPAEESADLYYKFAEVVKNLTENEDYNVDEKMRSVTYSEAGLQKVEQLLGVENLYAEGLQMVHHAEAALRAHALFRKDRDYVVRGEEVIIVDEFTGRLMEGRRYSEGLHQAIEAKEHVKIQRESRTLATITFQNYFRLYAKLGGMTGTAATEAEEFAKIYKLEVTQVPTHRPLARVDLVDRIFKSEKGKWMAVVREVKERHEKGQPVLIGTVSIEKNELLSAMLTAAGVPHRTLNAKNHESEAETIAQAGKRGAVTLATNMAGRGVDIILGGNPPDAAVAEEVRALGGLHVIGTERHESRRIDNQLRGRAARQGDPGSTQFFLSLEDDLMRIFGGDRVKNMMNAFKIEEDMPIESGMVSRALESAQKRVEGHNFDTRKHVLEYDDVLNRHRTAVYAERYALLANESFDALAKTLEMAEKEIERVVYFHTSGEKVQVPDVLAAESDVLTGDWDPREVIESARTVVPLNEADEAAIRAALPEVSRDREKLATDRTQAIESIMAAVKREVEARTGTEGDVAMANHLLRMTMLRSIDMHWMQHLDDMTYLRRTIGLQGYAQRDPLVEYKKESFRLYSAMRDASARDVVYNSMKILDQAAEAKKLMESAGAAAKMLGGLMNSGETKLGA